MVRQAASTNPVPSVGFVNTSDGLRVEQSILALDAKLHPGLSFISQPIIKSDHILGQLLTSEDSAALMDVFGVKSRPLFCPYNRPFSVGKMRFELLPSGGGAGSASLLLNYENQTILYAPCLQIQKVRAQRRLQLRKAGSLILAAGYAPPTETPPSRGKALTNFEHAIEAGLSSVGPAKMEVYTETLTQFFEVLAILQSLEHPVTVHRRGFQLCKALTNSSLKLKDQIQLNGGRRSKEKIMVRFCPPSLGFKSRKSSRPHQILLCHSEIENPALPMSTQAMFRIPDFSYGSDYESIIKEVRPKKVYFFGHLAKSYADHFTNTLDISCQPLYTDQQPTLF
ncbi:MAG: hypothetical protein OXT67_13330 [Zetaproteobacteria bacterium]|nr:hypothetical protein [Zetaproteobacteria bacterium]